MRSIRSRITAAIVGPLVCLLLAVLLFTARGVVRQRESDVDDGLKARAAALAGHVAQTEEGWVVDFEGGPGPAPDVTNELVAWRVTALPTGEVLDERAPGLLPPLQVRPVVTTLPSDVWHRPLFVGDAEVGTALSSGDYRWWTGAFLARIERGDVEMVRGLPSDLERPPILEVTVVRDMAALHRETYALLGRLALLGLVGASLAFLIGRWLSGRVVRPIQARADEAAAVRLPLVEAPLALSGTGDELDQLTSTLNDAFLRAQRAYERQQRFTSDASHELRTPLSVIRSEVELALRLGELDASSQESFESILVQASRMQSTLEQLLWLARADDSEAAPHTRLHPLDVARNVVAELRNDARWVDRGLPTLSVEGSASAEVLADEIALEIVLRNVIENAVRHTESSGTVAVRVEETEQTVRLVVIDTGCGIEPEHLPRLVERFYQVDASRTGSNAGLGLSIVSVLTKSLGGTLNIESRPREGTSVTVMIPRAA